MAGRANLLDLDEQGVAVAIERDVFDGLGVAAFLAFHPEFLAGAAPEVGFAGGDGFFERSAIHPRHHQDAAGPCSCTMAGIRPSASNFSFS